MKSEHSKRQIFTMGNYALLTLAVWVGLLYLNTFATEVLLIPATTLATALLVAKVIDFIVSLFSGVIIEKFKLSNKGKNQSWLYIGRWILAVTILVEVCNTSSAPMVVRVAVLAVDYTILNCLMNMVQAAYYALVAVVSGSDMDARSAMTVSMTRQMTVVSLVCAFIPTLVTVMPFGNWNYFVVAFVFMLPMPWALGRISKEGDGLDVPVGASGEVHQVGIMDMLGTLIHNPQMMILFIAVSLMYIATYWYQGVYTYYFIYIVGDFSLMTVASLIAAVVSIFAAMIMPKAGAKMGKKNSIVLGFGVFGIAMILVGIFAANSWIIYTVIFSLACFATYTYTPYLALAFLDCGEYYLYKTGKDTRAVAASLYGPPMKIGMALGGSIGLYLLGATGYYAGFTPTAAWIPRYMTITFTLPGVLFLIAAAIILILYKISDADAAKYTQANMEKMMADAPAPDAQDAPQK